MRPSATENKSHWLTKALQENRLFQLLLFFSFLTVLYFLPFWSIVDAKYNDFLIRHVAEQSRPSDQIIIIEIDDKSTSEMEAQVGHWPWPRSQHAILIEQLRLSKAKAIVFDMFLSERDIYRPDSDDYFNETVRLETDIFLAASLLSDQSNSDQNELSQLPLELFKQIPKNSNPSAKEGSETINILLPWIVDPQYWQVGLVNFNVDTDFVARKFDVFYNLKGWQIPSLPYKIYSTLYPEIISKSPLPQSITLKYKGIDKVPFNSISYVDALNNFEVAESEINEKMFKGKIVIVGATATGLHDLRSTPISANYPGTAILAAALSNMIERDYFVFPFKPYRYLLLIAFGSILFYLYLIFADYKKKLFYSGFYILGLAGFLSLTSWYASSYSILINSLSLWIILAISYTLLSFYQGLIEFLQRQHAMRTFSRFMDPEVVRHLIADKEWASTLAHKTSQVSVLFSDIRGFTSLSEKRSAEQVMEILNDYFDLQVEAIFSTRGTLDKFIGDAVMAFWGAPIDDEEHAVNAVKTALKMVDNLMAFRKTLPVELQEFDVGIGIHSGEAVVGMLGSKRRFDYTAIGDTVNLASRIEGVTKGRARVLVSQTTKDLCVNQFEFIYSGEFSVKGREEKVKLYEPKLLENKNSSK